jgi:hypothetical protein
MGITRTRPRPRPRECHRRTRRCRPGQRR